MPNYNIVDPNMSATKRLIAQTDWIDIAATLARAYFSDRYVRQDPRRNNYSMKPVRVVDARTGRCEMEFGWIPASAMMVGKVGS
jgi:hypothetical protein